MEVYRGYRLELKLNKTQQALCVKSAGTARYAYNWMLHKLIERYETAKKEAKEQGLEKPKCKLGSSIDWHREWCAFKKEYPWILEVSKCCGQSALQNLEKAFKRFFLKTSSYPKYKKRGEKDSFTITGNVYIKDNKIQIARIGRIKLKEKDYPKVEGKLFISQATISRQADRWFVSFFLKEEIDVPDLASADEIHPEDILGVDLGIKELAITSDGQTFENPKAYQKYLKKLKKYQRRVSRKKKGSKNRKKATTKLAKVHKKISDVRTDSIHKLTTSLVKTKPKMVVIETLKPNNMAKNHKLAGAILDSSFGKIKELLKYKCEWVGIHLVFAPQFYASSKFCSSCGAKHKELKLSDREWTCEKCGVEHDRDVNAAKNLQFFGLWLIDKHLDVNPTTGSSLECKACGDERLQFLIEQCSSVKQEIKLLNCAPHSS
jgi:putative transposase